MCRSSEIGAHTFPMVQVLFSHQIHMLWYTLYVKFVGFPINFAQHGKMQQIHKTGRAREIGTHFFLNVWVLFFHQISILWYTLPHGKCMAFPINFYQHKKMQQNPPYELSGCFSAVLLFLLVPKSGNSLKEQTEKTDKVNSFFKKRKINSRYARFQSKKYQKKNRTRMQFHQKRGICQAKVCHPTKILPYF